MSKQIKETIELLNSFLRLVLIYSLRIFIRILHVFPMKKGRIIFNSYRGKAYSCNPKYLSEYLEKYKQNEMEIIWVFRDAKQFGFLEKRAIRIVPYNSFRRFYYEVTAQFSINNVGSFSWLPLRKGQIHINTWHGGGCYKRAALGVERDKFFIKSQILNASETSFYISSSQFFSDVILKNDFGYEGKIITSGMPRNDILFQTQNSGMREEICNKYHISNNSFLVLYAPTWRDDMKKELETPNIDLIKTAIKHRFNKECVILYRAHPNILSHEINPNIVNVSNYYDMQELLLISDMLITDYSSSMWDYSITKKPCILFTPDLCSYEKERGFVVDIYKWGFPICLNNEELEKCITEFDYEDYVKNIQNHHKELGSFEIGTACKQVYEFMIDKIK